MLQQIKFEDIKKGDRLYIKRNLLGVLTETYGIAHELLDVKTDKVSERFPNPRYWVTKDGGTVIRSYSNHDIYLIA